jgi:hypothetical protein
VDTRLDFRIVWSRRADRRRLSISEERFLVRYLFPVSLLVVFLVGCGETPRTGVAVEHDLRPYIPSNATALASIQIEKLKATDLYKRHLKDLDIPELNAMSERLGLDPRRDLTSLLAVWDGKRAIFLTKGAFAPDQLKQRLATLGAKSVTYKKYTIFDGGANSVALIDNGLAAGGPADALHAALDRRATGEGSVPDELEQQLKGIMKDAQIWEVSRGGIPLSAFPARTDVQSMLGNFAGAISETTVGLHCDSGIRFQADIKCVSKEGAKRVHDALRGLVGLARLSTNASQMDLLRLWDAVNVNQDEDTVHIRADLSADLTEKLFIYLPQMKNRARQMAKPF